ncbi:substrate-binding domain-containing protein [Actinomadura sp. B10D3]|uniref:substrate-binding domain-containing protein n=1 Tax=Actinomadura sp. B10D3 TaxID=3153557 RepID=UPI00325D8B89
MDEEARPLLRRQAVWATAALVLSGAAGGAWASGLIPGPASCSGQVRITVAAQPEIAPALSDVASRFNVEKHRVGGRCAHARVTATPPTAYRGDASRTDAWVPESSLWLGVVREAGDASVPVAGTPVASTPVVLATTRPVAREFGDAGVDIGWTLLLKGKAGGLGLARTAPDPGVGMSGAIAMIAVGQVAEGKADDVAEALRKRAPSRMDAAAGGSAAVLAGLTGAERFDRPVIVTTEQAVIAYNGTHRPNPAVGLVPEEGTLMLDHPYVVTAKDQRRRDAAGGVPGGPGDALGPRRPPGSGVPCTRRHAGRRLRPRARPAGGGPAPAPHPHPPGDRRGPLVLDDLIRERRGRSWAAARPAGPRSGAAPAGRPRPTAAPPRPRTWPPTPTRGHRRRLRRRDAGRRWLRRGLSHTAARSRRLCPEEGSNPKLASMAIPGLFNSGVFVAVRVTTVTDRGRPG